MHTDTKYQLVGYWVLGKSGTICHWIIRGQIKTFGSKNSIGLGSESDPDSTYFIMSVWPIKNPCEALGVCWDLFARLLVELIFTTIKIFNLVKYKSFKK